jgi:type II secretion system protein G
MTDSRTIHTSTPARAGFALVELLVYITILGFLVVGGVAVFKYLERGKKYNATATVRNLKTAIQSYHADTGQYPVTLNDLVKRPADEHVAKKWAGDYWSKKTIDKDPWGSKYQYRLTPENKEHEFELFSYGPNKKKANKSEYIDAWDL